MAEQIIGDFVERHDFALMVAWLGFRFSAPVARLHPFTRQDLFFQSRSLWTALMHSVSSLFTSRASPANLRIPSIKLSWPPCVFSPSGTGCTSMSRSSISTTTVIDTVRGLLTLSRPGHGPAVGFVVGHASSPGMRLVLILRRANC